METAFLFSTVLVFTIEAMHSRAVDSTAAFGILEPALDSDNGDNIPYGGRHR